MLEDWDPEDGEPVDVAEMEPVVMRQGPTLLQELCNSLVEHHELLDFPQPALRMDRAQQNMQPTYEIPNFADLVTIEQMGDSVLWSFTIPDVCEDRVSIRSSSRTTDIREKYKIRHDFVSEGLSLDHTDVRLDRMFPPLNDSDDKITPDFIFEDEHKFIHVVEIGTTRTDTLQGMVTAFRDKMFKYEMPIRNRQFKSAVTYTAIIVGSESVASNHRLPVPLVNELITRMRIAIALEDQAVGKHINITSDGAESELSRNAGLLKEVLQNMEGGLEEPPGKIGINDDFIEDVIKEPLIDRVLSAFTSSVSRAQKGLLSQPDGLKLARDFMAPKKEDESKRLDRKPVTVMPLISCASDNSGIDATFKAILGSNQHRDLTRLWKTAFSKTSEVGSFIKENPEQLLKEAYEVNVGKAKSLEQDRKVRQKKWHRVNLKSVLDSSCMNYLRRDGLFGKKSPKDPWLKQRRKAQKVPFSLQTATPDIEDFINDDSLFQAHDHPTPHSVDDVLELIGLADNISENKGEAVPFCESWLQTNLFESMDIVSDLAYELAASLKQNTKPNEFLLKKLRNREIYILIKPTSSQSHVFYSVLVMKEAKPGIGHPTVFRGMHDLGNAFAMDFCSVKASKIENLANSSALVLTLASFWSEFYSLPYPTPQEFLGCKEARQMMLYSLLVSLEDKACTEEIITNTRYMYMEVFKSEMNIRKPNPFKILEKMPSLLRSRLSVFTLRKIVHNFTSMTTFPPRRRVRAVVPVDDASEDTPPDDAWDGLRNFLTGGNLPSASSAINLMYIGYFKNKNQEAEGNTEWKMVEKILEEEFELKDNELEKSFGKLGPGEKPGKKQFDRECVKHGCSILEGRLSRSLGPTWKTQLEREITNNLAKHLTHEVATLKASSTCNHIETKMKAKMTAGKSLWRVKVIEAIACKLGLAGLNPMLNIEKVIKFIEGSSAGIICDLFKKNQHGGLREIYVLTLESRLVQLFIETIARTICSHFEEEALTHPANKIRILDQHKTRMAREARKTDSVFADYCSSSDKTRWNQNFVMPAMSIALFRFTTPIFHNAIKRSLNLWANKLIMIPPNVLDLLMSKTKLTSEVYSELLNKFWGKYLPKYNRRGLNQQVSKYLNLTTGMMQGILHYTSSLLHLCCLASSKAMVLSYLRRRFTKSKFFMSQVCSSDDSATIISVMTSGESSHLEQSDLKALYSADLMGETLAEYCSYFCMRDSVKSTTSLNDYVEFNSEFLLKNTISIPIIKYVAACLNLTESSSFVSRFQNMYNLISSLRASGMSAFHTYLCQIAQAWQHYKTMGSNNSSLFSHYKDRIMHMPSPVHGFFLLDNRLVTGVLGYSFSRWLLHKNCSEISSRAVSTNITEMEVLKDGGVISSLKIKHGDNRRWIMLLDRVETGKLKIKNRSLIEGLDPNKPLIRENIIKQRDDRVNSNPELFFRHPGNIGEVRDKLLIKASMPGVADSLGKGNPFIQALSLSIYCLFTHAFLQTSTEVKHGLVGSGDKRVKVTRKHSLLSSLRQYRDTEKRTREDPIPKETMDELFPLGDKYSEALDIIHSYDDSVEIEVARMRVKTSVLVVQPRCSDLPLNLQSVVGLLWYKIPVRASNSVYKRCLEHYRVTYPWLLETFEASLKASPFEKPIELYNFISTQNSRSRKFKMFGPAIYSNRFAGQLSQTIKKSFKKGVILRPRDDARPNLAPMPRLTAELGLALQIPLAHERVRKCNTVLNQISEAIGGPDELINMSKRDARLGLIALFYSHRLEAELVPHHLKQLNQGMIITFMKEQRRVVDGNTIKWVGPGEAVVIAEGVSMVLTLNDDTVVEIRTRDLNLLRRNVEVLRTAFDQLGLGAQNSSLLVSGCDARFNGGHINHAAGTGTPIVVDSSFQDMYANAGVLFSSIYKGRCGIYQTIRERTVTIVEFKSGPKDVDLQESKNVNIHIWDAWVKSESLDVDSAYENILLAIMAGDKKCTNLLFRNLSREQSNDLRKWMRETLQARLRYRCLGNSPFNYADSVVTTTHEEDLIDDETALLMLQEMNTIADDADSGSLFSFFQDKVVEAVTTQIERENADQEDFSVDLAAVDMDRILLYEYDLSPLRTILSNVTHEETEPGRSTSNRDFLNYYYIHPLWDNLINALENERPGFFYTISMGEVPIVNSSMARDIMRLLEIKEKKQEQSLSARFRTMRLQQLGSSSHTTEPQPGTSTAGLSISNDSRGMVEPLLPTKADEDDEEDEWWEARSTL